MSTRVPAERVLVVDAGTSALRALLVDGRGEVERVGARPWSVSVPEDGGSFARELGREEVGLDADALVEQALADGPPVALAFTGQREGLVFADGRGEALLISPNIDARASAEGMAIDATYEAEVYRATGHLPSLLQATAKHRWFGTHRPAAAARVRTVMPLVDWLAMRLTGERRVSRSLGVENGLLDVQSGQPPDDLFAKTGLPRAVVPEPLADGDIAGRWRGIPVMLAGGDTQCALAGMGALRAGECGVPAGWTAPLQLVTDRPLWDCERRTWTGRHVVGDAWVLESNAGETGRAWDWLCDLLRIDPAKGSDVAATALAGGGDALAVLGAPTMRASAMNAGIGGLLLPLPLVMSAPDRPALLRSVLEATAFALRANLEQLEAVSGAGVPLLRLGGGMSRSPLFAQLVADVAGRPVEVARSPETSALGAAALAFAAMGAGTTGECVARIAGPRRTQEPDLAASAAYDDIYARWREIGDALTSLGGGA